MSASSFLKKFTTWNRKLHFYVGLFLLLFIWLFSFTGLLLNHSDWEFASFWKERKETETIRALRLPADMDSSALLRSSLEQLNISGEIKNVEFSSDSMDFRTIAPGLTRTIHIDLKNGMAEQKETRLNAWGKLRTLHTFNGADKGKAETEPNWLVTRIWRFSMDGIAIGLIFLCVSSWLMWYKIRKNYVWGPLVLVLGFAGALYFVFLLAVM